MLAFSVALGACANIQDAETSKPDISNQSLSGVLSELPQVKSDPLIVGVYSIPDQTGQRALSAGQTTMSSAIPQGLTALLVQELTNVGEGAYFRVVERENIDDLLNERRIVASTLGESAELNLQPLLLPGVLLTGSAVSYDRKVYQNFAGIGAASINLQKDVYVDRVGFVLRATSVQTGEVLESIYVSKEVRSQVSGLTGLKIIDEDMAGAEIGSAANEPTSIAVRKAIAAAVNELSLRGIERGWWKT